MVGKYGQSALEFADGSISAVIFLSLGKHPVDNLADDRSIPVGDDVLEIVLGSLLQADIVRGQQGAGFGCIDFDGLRQGKSCGALILALGLFEFSECIGLGFGLKRRAFPLAVDQTDRARPSSAPTVYQLKG